MRSAAVLIQKYFRGYLQKKKYQQMFVGYLRLQAVIRSRVLSHRFKHLRGHIVRLQAHSRGYLIRRMCTHKMWAIIKIQTHVRRIIAQRRFNKIKVYIICGVYLVLFIFFYFLLIHCIFFYLSLNLEYKVRL